MSQATLSQHTMEFFVSCPKAGNGVHNWLFRAALKLHRAGIDEQRMQELLVRATEDCGRVVEDREIEDAIHNSRPNPDASGRRARHSTSPDEKTGIDYDGVEQSANRR